MTPTWCRHCTDRISFCDIAWFGKPALWTILKQVLTDRCFQKIWCHKVKWPEITVTKPTTMYDGWTDKWTDGQMGVMTISPNFHSKVRGSKEVIGGHNPLVQIPQFVYVWTKLKKKIHKAKILVCLKVLQTLGQLRHMAYGEIIFVGQVTKFIQLTTLPDWWWSL